MIADLILVGYVIILIKYEWILVREVIELAEYDSVCSTLGLSQFTH